MSDFTGHTPRPWILMRHDSEEYDNQGPYKIWEPLEASGKEVIAGEGSKLWEATVPDALLIAAAPDLLAENKRLREYMAYIADGCEFPRLVARYALQEDSK